MAADRVSRKTPTVLRELLVGTTLRFIDDEFQSAGLMPDEDFEPPISGARRSRVEQYYHRMDFAEKEDADRLLLVCESMFHSGGQFSRLLTWLERDGYRMDGGRLIRIREAS